MTNSSHITILVFADMLDLKDYSYNLIFGWIEINFFENWEGLSYVKFIGFEISEEERKESLGVHNVCFYLVLNMDGDWREMS